MTSTSSSPTLTGAQVLVQQFAARGVRRIFGVPGGDCSLDIIEAASAAGIDFVLARNENAAAMMASVTAELSGGLGVLLTTRGPGLANGANGVACASLDRSALLVISDGYENEQAFVSHQRFDQRALLAPVTKGALRVDAPAALASVGALLDLALQDPPGPVYLELTGKGIRCNVPAASVAVQVQDVAPAALAEASLAAAQALMQAARRPVAGLQAADAQASAALRELVARWGCPVFATYKGKGAVSDRDDHAMGHFMAGGAEDETMHAADLIVTFGADPIEFLPKPWAYKAPVVQLSTHAFARDYGVPAAAVVGDIAQAARRLTPGLQASGWQPAELAALKAHMRQRARVPDNGTAITPNRLVDVVCAALPDNARIAVDAGAHMLPVMAAFEARRPRDVLISRGLATMAYALPAAIGAALEQPDRPVVAFTGDGGLMMCASELATAVQAGCKITVFVFNDSSIALIGVKQQQRKLRREGMDYTATDFAQVARGFGCEGIRVNHPDDLQDAVARDLGEVGGGV
ncbi:MAG: thiamine pyrophosphate-binding protein, partial [Comamonadaceae bacterium]